MYPVRRHGFAYNLAAVLPAPALCARSSDEEVQATAFSRLLRLGATDRDVGQGHVVLGFGADAIPHTI